MASSDLTMAGKRARRAEFRAWTERFFAVTLPAPSTTRARTLDRAVLATAFAAAVERQAGALLRSQGRTACPCGSGLPMFEGCCPACYQRHGGRW